MCEIRQMSPKTCDLDPIPASLLFECYDETARVLLDIVNDCLSTSSMTDSLKRAIVKHLLKKSSLDPNVLKYFRPVSNLPLAMPRVFNDLLTSVESDHILILILVDLSAVFDTIR